MSSKACFKCNESKPLTEFYKHSEMADGHLGKCKQCTKQRVNENRRKRSEYYKAYDRVRYYEHGHRAAPSKEAVRCGHARWLEANEHKREAHLAVQYAVRTGRLIRPDSCARCGERGPVQGHHHDYSKVLDVEWLCSACHGREHRVYDEEESRTMLTVSVKGNRWSP